jgi:tetratricopeptide (TPR) repeat protein
MVLKSMAQIHHERKEYSQAGALYEEVGRRKAAEPLHPEIASTLNKLGNLLYERADLAIQIYKEGLEVERVLDVFHPNMVVTLTNIGQIYKIRGELPECSSYVQRSDRHPAPVWELTSEHFFDTASIALSTTRLVTTSWR